MDSSCTRYKKRLKSEFALESLNRQQIQMERTSVYNICDILFNLNSKFFIFLFEQHWQCWQQRRSSGLLHQEASKCFYAFHERAETKSLKRIMGERQWICELISGSNGKGFHFYLSFSFFEYAFIYNSNVDCPFTFVLSLLSTVEVEVWRRAGWIF